EQAEAEEIDALLAEEAAEERGQRHEHHGGDDEPGGHPGYLLDGGAERAREVRRRHGDDRGVDGPHQRPEDHREGGQPLVDRRARGGDGAAGPDGGAHDGTPTPVKKAASSRSASTTSPLLGSW